MRGELRVSAVALAAITFTTISSIVDIILAIRLDERSTLQSLLYAAFALQFLAFINIVYFCVLFSNSSKISAVRSPWIDPTSGAGFNAAALIVTGVAVIYYASQFINSPSTSFCLQIVGLTAWALSILWHAVFFLLLNLRVRKVIDVTIPQVLVTNLGTEHPSQKDLVLDARASFYSRDTTLVSRSCTPTSPRTYSLHSSTTRAASSIRSKFARHSARSSLDLPAVPAAEASVLGTAFDKYDTPNIDYDVRNTIASSSPTATRSGLATIPGSRPNSPGDTLTNEEAMLPTSPKFQAKSQSPSDTIKSKKSAVAESLSSSPTNFSRPTSKSNHQPTMSGSSVPFPLKHVRSSASMTDLIHPLFRPDSPSPPQILTSGTMVTASPFANQPITPKTLSKLRSSSDLRSKSIHSVPSRSPSTTAQWRVMPPIESSPPSGLRLRASSVVQRPTTADSGSYENIDSSLTKTDTIGSPGPSIIDDEELPPILPGFVLSAGSRSSLVGYGKRKSVKRESSHML